MEDAMNGRWQNNMLGPECFSFGGCRSFGAVDALDSLLIEKLRTSSTNNNNSRQSISESSGADGVIDWSKETW
jgi:hypothetical protein